MDCVEALKRFNDKHFNGDSYLPYGFRTEKTGILKF